MKAILLKLSSLVLIIVAGTGIYAQPGTPQDTIVLPAAADSVVVSSPDGALRLVIQNTGRKITYSITCNQIRWIEPSGLGLAVNGKIYGENTSIAKLQRYKGNESFVSRGVHSKATEQYNGATISFTGPASFMIGAKVFNNGVAFRYIINTNDSSVIEKEYTEFVLPAGSITWSQPNIKYYEGKYTKKLADTLKTGELMGPPVTVELPGNAGYAAITEAGLTDFAGMSLIVNGARTLQANLSGQTKKKGTIETPWRVIETGADLNSLVNCDIIASLSPGYDKKLFPQGYATTWIKPGRSVWSWLAETRAVTVENMKHFSDLAAQLGFEYNLVDEGWGNWKDSVNHKDRWDLMKELVDYSIARGVKIWVWKAYPDRKGIPGIKDPAQRKIFFEKCKELGISGIKIDFFDAESQEIIQFYQAALHDAAEYHLMIDFHGANKPTGESRTWPNEMTREGIRGLENRPPWASFNTILPFTRYLAGHADYTPVHFGERIGEVSWAHHIASMIIFTSPFLCLGADPQSILSNPCKEMIQSVPTVWDETIVLPQSKIGELVLFARRKNDTWFLAAMNGTNEPKTIPVDLSFLKSDYMLSSVTDDANKQDNAIIQHKKIPAHTTLTIVLNGNGGYAGRFEKIKQ